MADAIQRQAIGELRDELGDLLLQVVFHAQMAREAGKFDFDDVAHAISSKMIRRHPHVFGEERIDTAAAQTVAWEDHKAAERTDAANARGEPPSVLDGVALAMPALMRAEKLLRRAARLGFEWPANAPAYFKIEEELAEIKKEESHSANPERLAEEAGDLLFACVALIRRLGVDAEAALRAANAKFERRFRRVERLAPPSPGLAELQRLWREVKKEEEAVVAGD